MKRPGSFFSRLKGNEKGNVIIIVALLMMVLMGITALVIDVGYLYQTRRQMVTAADAGALAGVVEFVDNDDEGEALKVAREYAIENESEDGQTTAEMWDDPYSIKVETGKNVDYIFAKFLGFDNLDVTAEAVAVILPLSAYEGIVPFTISEEEYDEEVSEVTIKLAMQPGEIGPGNFHILDLKPPGADAVKTYTKYGYDGKIRVGQELDTQTGQIAAVEEAIQYRFDQCEIKCGSNDGSDICSDPDCPRKVIVPIFNKVAEKPGKTEVTVAGFASVYLISVPSPGGSGGAGGGPPGSPGPPPEFFEINAIFIKALEEDEVSGEGKGSSIDFGTYNVKLLE